MFKWFGLVSYTSHTKVAGFAEHLRDGRMVGSRCDACGETAFPPRADCASCMSPEFSYVALSGRGTLHTYTRIDAGPAGFEDRVPYTLGLVDLEEGGRALAAVGESMAEGDLRIGMDVRLVPRMDEESEEIHVYYTLERPAS